MRIRSKEIAYLSPMTPLDRLKAQLGSAFATDDLQRTLYATDASVYRVKPFGVCWPRHLEDLQAILDFAREEGMPLIPRTAGTSLAGQVVGEGLVVDFSRYMNKILNFDPHTLQITVEPGVIRDQLNQFVNPHGLHFGPNTSTANRCMMGGMVGNNSCGTTSIVYGSTRDKLVALDTLLSDGSTALFEAVPIEGWEAMKGRPGLEGKLYRDIETLLLDPVLQKAVPTHFPKPQIHRRNTGYALDVLLQSPPFIAQGPSFNFCNLLAGSEGTLALSHAITLQLDPLPPPAGVLVCAHFHEMRAMTESVVLAMQHPLYACELMDKTVLDCALSNREQQANRFFIQGQPQAILMMECRGQTEAEAMAVALGLIADMKLAYAYPVLPADQMGRALALRAAGLGVLANLPGDPKAVACIEDTAVAVEDLPDYIDELTSLIASYDQKAVFFAHAGAGEIHVRPILNLKVQKDRQVFHDLTQSVALLVKKYQGSFSGEHGDGRVRGGFLPLLFGPDIYAAFRQVKALWDPQNLFNPGKIVDVPPMLTDLRYESGQITRSFRTAMDFDAEGGILRMAERCNGSGDCRKLPESGGTMCPSYHVTREEKDTTRARANTLREYLTRSSLPNPFAEPAITEVMDLCLSCKGCTRECPSGVDMTTLKAEVLYQRYRTEGTPLSARIFGRMPTLSKIALNAPGIANFLSNWGPSRWAVHAVLGIHASRRLPLFNKQTFRSWHGQLKPFEPSVASRGSVWLFVDEFTDYLDGQVGQDAVRLLQGLGYRVNLCAHPESGRAAMSKGLLAHAARVANENVARFKDIVNDETPLIGLEPSAILGFRDEYLRLVGPALKESAKALSAHTYLLEEFLYREAVAGRITAEDFDIEERAVFLHGHCHQKALSNLSHAAFILALPTGNKVEILPGGCCGMAGSFGYEKDHYDISMKIGEDRLFPAIRAVQDGVLFVASGHSCRHQIADGTGRKAMHAASFLVECLAKG